MSEDFSLRGKALRYLKHAMILPHRATEAVVKRLRRIEAALLSHKPKEQSPANIHEVKTFPALRAQDVAGARLYATRADALELLPRGGNVAEIGVALGDFSAVLLEKLLPQKFSAFDIFRLHEVDHFWGRSSADWLSGLTHRAFYEQRFETEIGAGRLRVFEGDSYQEVFRQPDASFDVIYIDGDHSYEGVLRDAEISAQKLKPNGVLVFNDYIMMDHVTRDSYGVVPVVNDFCVNRGWSVLYLALDRNLFCDIGLRRNDSGRMK